MNMIVHGAGGGSKGGSATEAPDSIRSSTIINVIEGLGEGPIVGLVAGGNSIYFDDTPLQNTDNSWNFAGVNWDQRTGLPEQTPLPGPNQTSTPFTVGTRIKVSTPVTRTIDDPTAAAVQIIMRIPALAYADPQTGDVGAIAVSYQILQRAAGGDWVVLENVNIYAKVTSPYFRQHFITAPTNNSSPWDIKIVRITADPDPVQAVYTQNETWWESYATIVKGKFTYDDTALVSLYVDAFLFGSNVGTRSYHVKGLIIDVPANYDPVARTYTGIWDGTFKSAWTNNPAWIFWDLLTNTRYGIGEFVQIQSVDKWSLYQIGQYCDALVPSGFSNSTGTAIMEPRFTYNGVINNRAEAYTVLQNLTAAFRGMAYWSLGQVFCAADMPSDPVCAITPANVIDGHFKYSGTAMKARHSVAVVTWNDPLNRWIATPEVVQDNDQIRRFGWRQTDVTLAGCTSRGQAHRYGKWILDTEKNQTETVQFSMSWDGYVLENNASLKPGDIILLTDPRKNGNFRAGGRLKTVTSASSMVLDFPFPPESGHSYTISALLPDGSFETKPISVFAGDNETITLGTAFSAPPIANADFIIQSTNMVARQYRVMAVQEDGENIFKVTALIHDPGKFDRVEQNFALAPIPYLRPRNVIGAVTGVTGSEARFFQNGVSHSRVTVSWTGPNDFQVADYLVTADSPHGFINFNSVIMPTLDVTDATPGDWTFYVVTRSVSGATSKPVSFAFTVQGWAAVSGPTPGSLAVAGGGTTFAGLAPTIVWTNVFPANYVQYDVINKVRVYDPISNALLRSVQVTTPQYTYSYEDNINDGGPRRSVRIDVTALNVTGVESSIASITVSNPAPALTVPTIRLDVGSLDISWVNNDTDYAGALVWVNSNPGFTPLLDNASYDGPDTKTVIFVNGGAQYVWLALYDAFGKTGLNISSPQHETVTDLTSTLAAAIPDLIAAAGQVTTSQLNSEMEGVGDQIAGILNQVVLDRDFNDQLHARAVQELSVKTDTMGANITSEQTARIEADFAEATARQLLQAEINGSVTASIATETTARVSADAALTDAITLANSNLGTTNASLATESTTRASADSALSGQFTTLSTTVAGHTSQLTSVATSINGVEVQYGVIGTIDGVTGGFLFTGIKKLDGSVSYGVEISGSLVVDGTISASKLNVTTLSAIAANVGTVTAGVIKSTDLKTVWDLTAGTLIVSD